MDNQIKSTEEILSTLLSRAPILIIASLVLAVTGCTSSKPRSPVAQDYLGAIGIGVSDLQKSSDFYQDTLGLSILRTYELGYLDEIVLGFTDATAIENPSDQRTALVLMNWPNDEARRYDGHDVKLVFYVANPAAVIERIRQRGGTIDREATPHPALNGRIIGLGRDPDNYVVEVIEQLQ